MRKLDLTGLRCPLPTLKTRKALNTMATGERLQVTADDPMSAIDMPHFVSRSNHRMVEHGQNNTKLWFILESGGPPADDDETAGQDERALGDSS